MVIISRRLWFHWRVFPWTYLRNSPSIMARPKIFSGIPAIWGKVWSSFHAARKELAKIQPQGSQPTLNFQLWSFCLPKDRSISWSLPRSQFQILRQLLWKLLNFHGFHRLAGHRLYGSLWRLQRRWQFVPISRGLCLVVQSFCFCGKCRCKWHHFRR